MLEYITAGESHGRCLVGILEGLPAQLAIDQKVINCELARRQKGYGRGLRMQIEQDRVEILSGLRKGKTIGAPLSFLISNKDFKIDSLASVICPRPGHADLAGALKFNTKDIRDILERASARETALRVGIGAVCKIFLREFRIEIISHVRDIAGISAQSDGLSFQQLRRLADNSCLNCADQVAQDKMIETIKSAQGRGDSLGGTFEVIAINLPPGLGSFTQWQRRLDGQLAQALVSIPAVKAVEIGEGIEAASLAGSQVHDAIFYTRSRGFFRKSNRAGGLEGGMTNGEPLILRAKMKPIATLKKPLASVNIKNKRQGLAAVERADVCAVPAAGIVGESMVAFCLARAFLDKFAGDSLAETKHNYAGYIRQVKRY